MFRTIARRNRSCFEQWQEEIVRAFVVTPGSVVQVEVCVWFDVPFWVDIDFYLLA